MRIEFHGVGFAYPGGEPVLRGVDLAAAEGELVVVVGANGSGKTTLLRVGAGYLMPNEGRASLDAVSVGRMNPRVRARRLACLEQNRRLDLDFTVREAVLMGRVPHRRRWGRETARDRRAVGQAMADAEISRLADRSMQALSGGERQRVFLAMALAQEPSVLILDEPTAHLDIHYQMELMEIIRSRTAMGMTILAALHDLTLAASYADRVAILHNGRIAADGTPHTVLTEAAIRDAFGARVRVLRDEDSGALTVLPRRSTGMDTLP